MKPHLPSALRRALLACCALSVGFTLSSGIAAADTTLGKTDTITIDYAASSTQAPLDAAGVLTLTGDTKLMLLNMGDITGFSYTLCTGVSGLQTADGELTLTTGNNSAEAYFDITAPGSSIWKDASLQWVDDKLLLVLNNTRVKKSVTITEGQTGRVDFQEYKGVSFASITGGAIIGRGDSTMSNNGSVSFSNNLNNQGSAIYRNLGNISLSNNGSVSFSGNKASLNGGAICVWGEYSLTLSDNGSVSFSGNKANMDGGAICVWGEYSLTLSNNGSVSFSSNTADLSGGAIYADRSTITLSNNGSVSFSGNKANMDGGAIFGNDSTITLSNNGSVSFSSNTADLSGGGGAIFADWCTITLSNNGSVSFNANSADDNGGAIDFHNEEELTLSNNGSVSFLENKAIADGGAIFGSDYSSITLSGNGSISFSGNISDLDGGAMTGLFGTTIELNNNSSISISENTATRNGGAIHDYESSISLNENGSVSFSKNAAGGNGGAANIESDGLFTLSNNGSASFSENTADLRGGAIYVWGESSLTLSDNGSVSFIGNKAGYDGGAIYGYASTISLSNNDKVCFEKNVSKDDGDYRLQSIYSTGGLLVLSAPENGSITFKDSIYAEGEVELNAAYDHDGDASTAPIAQSGTITFTGEQAETDLKSYLDDNNITLSDEALAEAIRLSKTSSLNGTATLYNGTLEVKKGAILEVGNTLTVNDGATLAIIDNGQLTNSGTLTLNGKTILGSTISNSGTVKLGGTIDISGITPYETGISVRVNEFGYEGTKSGFLREGDCRIKVVNGGTIEDTGATIDYNGEVMTGVSTLADGIVQVKTQDINYREYLLENTDNATYSNIATASGGQLERISLRGGILNLDSSLDSGVTLKILGDNMRQSIDMWENVVLSKGSLEELSDSKELIISGKASSVYEITGELGLGAGVLLKDWNGTVRATDTTLSSGGVDTTEWNNTELKGVTTVRQGATLTLGGNVLLCGKISNSGTLNLTGNITVDAENYAPEDAVKEVLDYYIGASALPNTKNSGFESAAWDITLAEGGVIDGSAATWTVTGIDAAGLRFDSDGTLHAYGKEVGSVFHVAAGDSITYGSDNAADFTNSKGTEATGISLNGGKLVLNTGLRDNRDDYVKSTAASTVEISNGVTLNAAQLDAGGADVTLAGAGDYTMESGANTLGEGVSVGADWSGVVNTTGDTTALVLDKLGVSGSKVELGSNSHTLAARDQEVAANLTGTGAVSLTGNKLTLSGVNTLGSLSVGSLVINGGSTAISHGLTTAGESSVADGASLSIDGSSAIGGKITLGTGSTLTLGGTITVDDTAFTAGTRERYSAGNNGYKITDSTYTVLTGGAVTDTATWKVGTQSATYEDGMVIVAGIEDTAVYYVRNGDVAYTRALADDSTKFSLEGGHLVLTESLKDTQSIEWKSTASWLNINNDDVELKSSQLSTVGGGDFTLIAPDGGTYIIDKKVGDIVELTLGTGVTLPSDYWWGTVKTAGDTTVSSDLDTTCWKNTELNGTTTVNNGVTLTLGGNTTLGGKIINSGTLNLQGSITVDTTTFKPSDAVKEVTGYFIGNSTTPNTTKSGFEAACWDITIAEGGTIDGTGATWKLKGDDDATFDFESDGTLHAYGSGVGSVFHVAEDDSITYGSDNEEDFTNSKGVDATGISLNGGKLVLNTGLRDNRDDYVKSTAASTVVIGNGVKLSAAQLDASAADVTLAGAGGYTMESGANTLGEGVSVGAGWSGVVNTTGDTTALELDKLGVSGSKVELGSNSHTLAARDQEVAANLTGTGAVSLTGNKLTLSGSNTLGSLSVGTLAVTGGSTTLSDGLTTTGESSVADGASLSIDGASAIGGKITLGTGSTLTLDGTITVNKDSFAPEDAVVEQAGYFIGSSTTPNSTNSGFEAACWDITIAEGGSIDDKGTTWKLVGDDNASFDFVESDGTLHAYGSDIGTVFHVAEGDSITYGSDNEEDFTNSKGVDATGISLNGGKLVLNTTLRDNRDDYVKSTAASTVEISNGVTLNAAQLDAGGADVTLSGGGSYDMQGQELDGAVQLGTGVALDETDWKGTVYTGSTAQGAELDIRALGNSRSTVYLGAQPMRRAMPGETVLESLTAAGVGTTVVPGPLTLQKGSSQAEALVVNGILTLGSADAAARLVAASVSLQGLNFAHADSQLEAGSLTGATTLNVQLTDEVLSNKNAGETLTLVTLQDGYDGTLTFNGDTETERVRSEDNRKEYTLAWNEDGTVLTLTILGTETYVAEQVKPTTHNGRAGVALMTDVFLNSRPQKDAPDGALAGILDAVDAGIATDRDMAAVAGASTAVLGQALSGDVERQLRAIRNRVALSYYSHDAVALNDGEESTPEQPGKYFAWVNAEGNRAEQNAEGTAAGYTLTSWGGTVGAGMQVNPQLTLGLALTAMYGDLQSDGPDRLDGDMDTTYVSAFARYASGSWSHAFIGTVGTMNADYKRTAMGYSNNGDADGTALGLMYELSRDYALSDRSSISPVFNIAYRHTEVDGYSESGTDAALNVGKQSLDTVTVGLGARYAAVVGQQRLNRDCAFEARALVKYDFGDTQTDTSVGFINHATRATIESAEMGAFGLELGAGISVPVGSGSIFADGAVELRSDYTNFNATVGYRIQF